MEDRLPDAAPLRLSTPDAVIAAVPYLLGFHPTRSAVLVWASGPGRQVVLTMRFDVPDAPPGPWAERSAGTGRARLRTEIADLVSRPLPHLPSDAAPIVLLYPDSAPDSDGPLPHEEFTALLLEALRDAGRAPLDALCVRGDRWWSYLCTGGTCCDLCGSVLDPAVVSQVAAACVLAGLAPVSSREQLAAELAPAPPAAVLRMRTALSSLGIPMRRRRAGDVLAPRELAPRCWRAMSSLATTGRAGDLDDQALVLAGLRDLSHRDAFLALALRSGPRACGDGLALLATLAPRHFRSQAAASLALLRYVGGDGARAWVAVDAALSDDPECTLAALVGEAVGSGLPPAAILDSFLAFDPDDLRMRRISPA